MQKFLVPIVALACLTGTAMGRVSDLSHDQQKHVIDLFDEAMARNYVFPELAKQTAKMLKDHLDNREYDSLTDPQTFCKTVSEQIRALCHDSHLRISYSEEVLPERVKQSKPTAEEVRRFSRMMQFRNGGFEKIDCLPGNIGYLEVTTFDDPEAAKRPLEAAMKALEKTDALILDLRRNGGGSPLAIAMLLSYFFEKLTHINDFLDGKGELLGSNWTNDDVAGEKYLSKPIYILVSKRTGSGAEECAYDLQALKRATVIGQPTWGGANIGNFFRLDEHFNCFITFAQAQNPYTKLNWEGTGVTPDVASEPADTLKSAHRIALHELLIRVRDRDDRARLEKALAGLESESK